MSYQKLTWSQVRDALATDFMDEMRKGHITPFEYWQLVRESVGEELERRFQERKDEKS